MPHTKVEGIDYTPEGIEALRQDVIVYRDRAIAAMPEGAEMAVVLSHTIALLAYLIDLVKEEINKPGWTNPLTDMES